VKGTQLWQGTTSPLIQGKSGRARPLWQPWLGATLSAVVVSNVVAWAGWGALPAEFFVTGSMIGALLGVGMARLTGSRSSWFFGALVALCADAALFASATYWLPRALLHIGKAG
jgi:hypothetical protein